MKHLHNEPLWVEKYRPQKIEDTILTKGLKKTFQEFVNSGTIPNLILSGGSGIGKTTVARAMLEELDCTYIIINGSLNGNIDTLRHDISQFASSISLTGGRKYVILDEADYLQPNSTQPALRNFMEEFSKNCGFIFTCNYKNKIIPALHSRCSLVEFGLPKSEMLSMATDFFKKVKFILDSEKVEYESVVLSSLLKKHMPDWRRIINELQRYSATGKIDSGILTDFKDISIKTLMKHIKKKDFTQARKWVAENNDIDSSDIFRRFYNSMDSYFTTSYIPLFVVTAAKYQYQDAFSVDKEINMAAFIVEVMLEAEFVQ